MGEEWKSIEARDVDETLCLSRKHAGSPLGVQRCPNNGHVLYVDVEDDVRGPTCVWVEEPPPDDFKLAATAEEADGRAGPPRELQSMVVVPCRAGRLLRFSGGVMRCRAHRADGSRTTMRRRMERR